MNNDAAWVGNSIITANGHELSDFDNFNWNQNQRGLTKPAGQDNKIDMMFIIWRNNQFYDTQNWAISSSGGNCSSGFGLTPITNGSNPLRGLPVQTAASYNSCFGGSAGLGITLKEYMHGLFGENWWHSSGGAGAHTFINSPGSWSLTNQGGAMTTACGWDRWLMEWEHPDKNNTDNEYISIGDQNVGEIITDFSIQTHPTLPNGGEFVLRDFMTTGDAIRITLPHLKDENSAVKNQYLWLENRRMSTRFDKFYDFDCADHPPGQFENGTPGIYAYIEVGKDIKVQVGNDNIYSSSASHPNGLGSWMFPLTAEGNYDFTYRRDLEQAKLGSGFCGNWDNANIPIDKSTSLPNPLTGFSDLFNGLDVNNNGQMHNTADHSVSIGLSEVISSNGNCNNTAGLQSGNVCHNYSANGDWQDAFCSATNSKEISLSTNPPSTTVYTFVSGGGQSFNSNPTPAAFENQTIWLNGLSIKILEEYSNGDVKVKIRWDDYEIRNDVRWCGNIKLSPNDFDNTQYSLDLKTNKTIHLDKGKSPTKYQAVNVNGEWDFTDATVFTVLPNAYFHLEANSNVIIDNGSFLKLQGKILAEAGSKIIVRNGGKLILESGSQLILSNEAQVIIEAEGKLEYFTNSNIVLNGTNTVIEIAGLLDIKPGATFTFTNTTFSGGYVKFNSNANPSFNINMGSNAAISLSGNSKFDKVLEITQESLYGSNNGNELSAFSVVNGTIAMGPGSRLQPGGVTTAINVDNVRLTSNDYTYNEHRGLTTFGQSNISINNCSFEYGKYGIYAYSTYGGAPLTINNSVFKNCETGLFSHDKGIVLNNCQFFNNTSRGWFAEMMSFHSTVNSGTFGGNSSNANNMGILYTASGTSDLFVNDPNISFNTNGVEILGGSLIAKCGNISDNTQNGISLALNANLIMNYTAGANGSQVTAINNGITIKASLAKVIDLYKGNNDLTPKVSKTKSVIRGTLYNGCNSYTIDATNNKWNDQFTSPNSQDYLLSSTDLSMCRSANIIVKDPRSIVPTTCGQAVNCPFPCLNELPMESCPGCVVITTRDFVREKLNVAIKKAISKMSTHGGNDDLDAIDEFEQIIKFPINHPKPEEEYLLDMAYLKMMEALGSAFSNGQLSRQQNSVQFSPEVIKVIDVQDKLLQKTNSKDYYRKLFLTMEKAQTYRLADRRELAIPIMDNILTWVKPDEKQLVEDWRCKTNTEQMLLTDQISMQEVLNETVGCNSKSLRTSSNKGYEIIDETSKLETEKFINGLINKPEFYPNPNNGSFTIITQNADIKAITIVDVLGRIIYNIEKLGDATKFEIDISDNPKGIYFIKFFDGKQTLIEKVIFQ